MTTLLDALQAVGVDSPAWLVLCAVLLAIAGAVARRQGLSARRQGARIGALEQLARTERIRRRQLEQVLREEGTKLPYWPGDPPEFYTPTAAAADDDQADDDLDTAHLETQYFTRDRLTRRTP